MSGVLCDRKLLARVKGKMYKGVVRPAKEKKKKKAYIYKKNLSCEKCALKNKSLRLCMQIIIK